MLENWLYFLNDWKKTFPQNYRSVGKEIRKFTMCSVGISSLWGRKFNILLIMNVWAFDTLAICVSCCWVIIFFRISDWCVYRHIRELIVIINTYSFLILFLRLLLFLFSCICVYYVNRCHMDAEARREHQILLTWN